MDWWTRGPQSCEYVKGNVIRMLQLLRVKLPVPVEDVPEGVREQMTFHLAEEIGEVLAAALGQETGAVGSGPEPLADVVAAA